MNSTDFWNVFWMGKNMNPNQNNPVTKNDAELIFKLLDIITAEIYRLFDSGMVLDESAGEYELEKLQNKMASKQMEIQKLRQMISKTRQYITRRKQIERQRKK